MVQSGHFVSISDISGVPSKTNFQRVSSIATERELCVDKRTSPNFAICKSSSLYLDRACLTNHHRGTLNASTFARSQLTSPRRFPKRFHKTYPRNNRFNFCSLCEESCLQLSFYKMRRNVYIFVYILSQSLSASVQSFNSR